MVLFTFEKYPQLEILFDMKLKTKGLETEIIPVHEFIGVKGVRAKGKKITVYPVKKLDWLEPLKIAAPEPEAEIKPADTTTENPLPKKKGKKKSTEEPEAEQMELF